MAAHLFRRAGFGASTEQLDQAVRRGPQETLNRLLADPEVEADSPIQLSQTDRETEAMASTLVAIGNSGQLTGWWLMRMHGTAVPLREKATLFWHGHFATSAAKVDDTALMMAHYRLLRAHAWGSFEPFVQAISRDPAMLIWLDSTTNRKTRPNENYARELMELFCLGEGNYTEDDIQEIARAFTGWEVRRRRFHFRQSVHDHGTKRFLGAVGNFDGDDAVRIVLQQPAAAQWIATKLVRFFVAEEPAISPQVIEPLAQQLRESDFQISGALRTILSSNLFYSQAAVGRKIRSPVDVALNWLLALEARTNFQLLAERLDRLGQRPFFPPNVKGWDAGRTWINTSTLLGRANLVGEFVTNDDTRIAQGAGLSSLATRGGLTQGADVINWLEQILLARPLQRQVREKLLGLVPASRSLDDRALGRLLQAVAALPESQLA